MALTCGVALSETMNRGSPYKREESNDCVGFSVADWAGDINDRKSISGYPFQKNREEVSWRIK